MRAHDLSRSMLICLGAVKRKRGEADNCEGCVMYGTVEYSELTCRRCLHEEAARLLDDMACDIERLGGCTMCMHYEGCKRDAKGTDVVLCPDFAYPEQGYRKYELERRSKDGKSKGKLSCDV